MFEQRNQLVKKDASSIGYQERVVVLEKNLETTLTEVGRLTSQNIGEKYLLDTVRTTLSLHKTALRSVLRRMLGIMRRYWLIRRLSTPTSVCLGRICKPSFILFRHHFTTR